MKIVIGNIGSKLVKESPEGKLFSKLIEEFPDNLYFNLSRGDFLQELYENFTSAHDHTYVTKVLDSVKFDGGIFFISQKAYRALPPYNKFGPTLAHTAPIYHFLNTHRHMKWIGLCVDNYYGLGLDLITRPQYVLGNEDKNCLVERHFSDTRFRDIINSVYRVGNDRMCEVRDDSKLKIVAHRVMDKFIKEVM